MAAAQDEAGRRVQLALCGRLSGLTQDMLTGGCGSCQDEQDPTPQRVRVRGVPRRSEPRSLLQHQPQTWLAVPRTGRAPT